LREVRGRLINKRELFFFFLRDGFDELKLSKVKFSSDESVAFLFFFYSKKLI